MHARHEMQDVIVVDGARARRSSSATWSQARSAPTSPTPWCWRRAGTATCSTCRPTRPGATRPRSGGRTSAAPRSATLATRRSTPRASRSAGSHQSKLTLMSESLRNDGRIWVPKNAGDKRKPAGDPRGRARLLSRAQVPELRQSRPARHLVPRGQAGVRRRTRRRARRAWASTSISPTPSSGLARTRSASGTATSSTCTSGSPTRIRTSVPMRIFPAVHYTMGGLWVDYNLMSTLPGLHVIGEANFSDHGANRLGASALMQGLADGYFVIPYTIGNYLASTKLEKDRRRSSRREGTEAEVASRNATLLGVQREAHDGFVPSRARKDHVGTTAAWPATRRA